MNQDASHILRRLPGRTRRLDRRLAAAGAGLQRGGLVRARSGNLSVRAGDRLRITAAGARLGDLRRRDLTWASLEGAPIGGPRPSSEAALHAAIYRARPDVGAVVHTHSPFATARACTDGTWQLLLEEAAYYDMGGRVAIVPPAPAGSPRLAGLAAARLGAGAAVLLARHGAVAVGADLDAAVDVARSLEHQAHVAWITAVAEPRVPRVSPPSEDLVLALEDLAHRVVREDAADRVAEQGRAGDHVDVVRRPGPKRDGVGDDHLLEWGGGEILEHAAAEDPVGRGGEHA